MEIPRSQTRNDEYLGRFLIHFGILGVGDSPFESQAAA
jgi:hypothetical protein